MRRLCRLAVAAVLLLSCAVPGEAAPLRLLVDSAYAPQHVPILLAEARGRFREAGIELLVEPGLGSNMVAVLVGQRRFDLGHVSAVAAAAAIAGGTPIRMVAVYQPRSTLALVGIRGRVRLGAAAAVEGLRVGVTPGAVDSTALALFRRANAMPISAMTVVPTERGAKLADLVSGRLDVAVGDGVALRAALLAQGLEPEVLELADAGVALMGFGFVASEAILAADPALVRRALGAVRAGFAAAAADPDAACAEVRARFDLPGTEADCAATLRIFLAHSAEPGAAGWGVQAPEAWRAMIAALRGAGELQGTRPPSFYYTNAAVP